MNIFNPLIRSIIISTLIFCVNYNTTAQSILLIESGTNVYNTSDEAKYVERKIDEETWVNYKGKNGEFIKISNFFGRDQYYPNGIFEGYVNINSVLDTSTRKDYKNLVVSNNKNTISTKVVEQNVSIIESSKLSYDIGKLYLGISKKNIASGNDKYISLNGYDYNIQLSFNSSQVLTQILLTGKQEDAMAVDTSIKDQIIMLKNMLIEKNGHPSQSADYPSFLELEDENITNLATWKLDNKSVFIGIGESNDLYFPSVIFKMK